MDRGAWQVMAHTVPKSWTQLKQFSMHASVCVYVCVCVCVYECINPSVVFHCMRPHY